VGCQNSVTRLSWAFMLPLAFVDRAAEHDSTDNLVGGQTGNGLVGAWRPRLLRRAGPATDQRLRMRISVMVRRSLSCRLLRPAASSAPPAGPAGATARSHDAARSREQDAGHGGRPAGRAWWAGWSGHPLGVMMLVAVPVIRTTQKSAIAKNAQPRRCRLSASSQLRGS
jgi:hypothetical protein